MLDQGVNEKRRLIPQAIKSRMQTETYRYSLELAKVVATMRTESGGVASRARILSSSTA